MNEEEQVLNTESLKQKARQWIYYIIIALVSLVITVFLPLVGSEGDIKQAFPTTTLGWIVWAVAKVSTAALNVVIFYCFNEQAEINIKDNDKYKDAKEKEGKLKNIKNKEPRMPHTYKKQIYGKKGVIIFVTTALALVGLENMILRWRLDIFLTYISTIIMGLVFGILQMKKTELYWIEEYPKAVDKLYSIQVLNKVENCDIISEGDKKNESM